MHVWVCFFLLHSVLFAVCVYYTAVMIQRHHNALCTLWAKKTWLYICDHNSATTRSIFVLFALLKTGRNVFTHTWKICPPHLNNVLRLPCKSETITFPTYNAFLEYMTRDVKYTIHQVGQQKNQLIVNRYVQNVRNWHDTPARKRVGHWSAASSISDCSKPCHPCYCCCCSSSVSGTLRSHTHVAEWETNICKWPTCRGHSFLFPGV